MIEHPEQNDTSKTTLNQQIDKGAIATQTKKDKSFESDIRAEENTEITKIREKLGFPNSKMGKIDLEDYKKKTHPKWRAILNKFSPDVQRELIDERPDPTDEDMEEATRCTQNNKTPVNIRLETLLQNPKNIDSIARTPEEVINKINKLWNLNIVPGKVYDENPKRYFKYSKMNGDTAKPSVMINGAISFGVARFIAALLRGDKNIIIWDIRRKEPRG